MLKQKIYDLLNKVYAITMMISFFAGVLPVVAFGVALIVGGKLGQSISLFFVDYYYPIVIVLSSISILIGLLALYIRKNYGFSVHEFKSG